MTQPGQVALSDDAQNRIQQYLKEVGTQLEHSGVLGPERDGILMDIHVQILDMLIARGKQTADAKDIEAVLSELDPPKQFNGKEEKLPPLHATGQETEPTVLPPSKTRSPGFFLILLFGVVLPLFTFVFEYTTSFCAVNLFDPLPTLLHIVLVLAVPAIYLFMLLKHDAVLTRRGLWLGRFAWGLALGVSLWYTMNFLLLMPIAVISIIYFGLGILPLTPFLSLMAGLRAGSIIKKWSASTQLASSGRPVLIGLLTSVALLFGYGARIAFCDYLVTSSAHSEDRQKLQWIKRLGLRSVLEKRCIGQGQILSLWPIVMTDAMLGTNTVQPATREQASAAYYRLYGNVPNPAELRQGTDDAFFLELPMSSRRPQGTTKFQFHDDTVVVPLAGLALQASRLEADIHTSAAVGYAEWTMTFRNDAQLQHEAWGLVELPAGGVVSRVTLWVNGEEREAAFAGTGQVTAAYQAVTARRQDPLLVTSAGDGRITFRCFPIQPSGGTMKIRLGITFPLQPSLDGKLDWALPRLAGRNFDLTRDLKPTAWIHSTGNDIRSDHKKLQSDGPGILSGILSPQFVLERTILASDSSANVATFTSADVRDPDKFEIVQSVNCAPSEPIQSIVLALDTSARVESAVSALVNAVTKLPAQTKIAVVTEATAEDSLDFLHPKEAAERLRSAEFEGGADNAALLIKAWQMCQDRKDTCTLVWVHASQGVQLSTLEPLEAILSRSTRHPRFLELQIADGMDLLVNELAKSYAVERVAWGDSLNATIERLFAGLSGAPLCAVKRVHRVITTAATAGNDLNTTTSDAGHISRLWAYEETMRRFRERSPSTRNNAVTLAARYQLVSPVTGAVVLENKSQYDDAGLTPVDPSTVPAVPEPAEWLLILVAAVLGGIWLTLRARFNHRTRGMG